MRSTCDLVNIRGINTQVFIFQNELSEDVLTSGLVHEIDAKVTARGRQKRVTFPHKLLIDYLAAWYLCQDNVQEKLRQAFKTWDDVKKHEEVVRVCCGLMKGREEVIMHLVHLCKEAIKEAKWTYFGNYLYIDGSRDLSTDEELMTLLQNECGLQYPHYVVYPSHGWSLSEVLNTGKLVMVKNLDYEEYDPTLPCNAEIAITPDDKWDPRAMKRSGDMKTLQRYKDTIIAIYIHQWPCDVMKHMSSLLPSSSLAYLYMWDCYLPKEVINSLAHMPRLMNLQISRGRFPHDDDNDDDDDPLVTAVNGWNGQSKLRVLNLYGSRLPVSVCHPLLVAIAANCPCLEELYMIGNTLSGCLAGFLKNPPPALRELDMWKTGLQTEDIESLTAAVTAGKLQHLVYLNLWRNKLSEASVTALLKGLTAAVTAGKLQHLEKLDLWCISLSEAALSPFLNALLNTLGDRKFTLYLGWGEPIIIAPSEYTSAEHYLAQIRQILNPYTV